ncbi:MAG: FAD:protein FMN transferase [bacterium]
MGAFARVSVPAAEDARLDECEAVARRTFAELENLFSVYKPDSEISLLGRQAGGEPIPVSPDTRRILELSLKYAKVSGGCFDPTVAPLVTLWGFNGGKCPVSPPPESLISNVLKRVGYTHLILSNNTARLDLPGMQLDLGGIAKGYAVDVCYDRLVGMGITNVMVDLGGNIRCGGTPAAGRRGWTIGVRSPFDPEVLVGELTLTDGMAVATSGNYEKFVTIRGKRYAHIMNPHTGYPVEGMAGVTVVSTSAVETDGMSTALFVLGFEKAQTAIGQLPNCHALFIPDRQPPIIRLTPGLHNLFTRSDLPPVSQ